MMQLIIDPRIIGAFASILPDETIDFNVKEHGNYRWYAHSQQIERIAVVSKDIPSFSRVTLTQLVFDKIGWDEYGVDGKTMKMRALFKEKKQFFYNEYF